MKRVRWMKGAAIFALAGLAVTFGCAQQPLQMRSGAVPSYRVEPFWPKPLKDNWIFGQVSSVAVDSRDHLWVLHRPATLLDDEKGALQKPPANRCCIPAPPVMEFDPDGNYVQGWGGARPGL